MARFYSSDVQRRAFELTNVYAPPEPQGLRISATGETWCTGCASLMLGERKLANWLRGHAVTPGNTLLTRSMGTVEFSTKEQPLKAYCESCKQKI